MEKFIFKIGKKKKKILYEKYQEKLQLKNEEVVKEGEKEPDQKSSIKLKEKNIPNLTQTIAVASLEDNSGCSYISEALYNYINKEIKTNSSCIVDLKGSNKKVGKIIFYNYVDICSLYDKYKYIIFDVGNLNNCTLKEKNEFRRSNIKIIISKYEKGYIEKIGEHIKIDNNYVKKWVFVFNQVYPKTVKKIYALMEDYECYCLPLFYIEKIDKNVREVFNNILFKKR